MDFDGIVRFVAVVDEGSFAAAARSLNITPQALAASIAKLERELDLVLFDRASGGISRATELAKDVVVARREHPLANRREVSLEDMRPFTWMLPNARRDSYEAVVNTYTEQSLRPPEHILFCDTWTVGLELLATEHYLLLVTPDLIWPRSGEKYSPFVVLPTRAPTIERHVCLMHRSDHALGAIAVRLRDKIVTEVGERRAATAATPRRAAGKAARRHR